MTSPSWQLHCPIDIDNVSERITLAHGEGARLTRRLIDEHIISRFGNDHLNERADAAHLHPAVSSIAVSTDSFVVAPLFFPGGDIGSLAVHGTVNDLAVSGARPQWMTLSMILEEGLPLGVMTRVLDSVADAATDCGVQIVAGDTKVVPHGTADGMFLNTTGVGELIDRVPPGPRAIRPGDAILVSGPIGRHGIAILCAREELGFDPPPESDCASLVEVVECLHHTGGTALRTVRDATRGGVSAVLHEWADDCNLSFSLQQSAVPISSDVRGASEVLGLDPLHIACEGTCVAVVAREFADATVTALRDLPVSRGAAVIGSVTTRAAHPVTIQRGGGSEAPVDEPSGAMLPRIC